MRKLLVILFVVIFQGLQAQQITTFILVRHAEKTSDGLSDPGLTEVGEQRALRLAALLKDTKVDAIYSTAFKRTTNTVMPLSNQKSLGLLRYDAMKPGPIDEMLGRFAGGTIVVCGHSNTIPWTANYLIGKDEFKNFDDSDYDNILVVSVVEKGKVVKVTWLSY